MIKIFNDYNLCEFQLNEINLAYRTVFNLDSSNYFSIIINHCSEEKYAFYITRMDILNAIDDVCLFITEEWLSTDIIQELPKDWKWNFPLRPLRIKIPLEVQAKALISAAQVTGDKYDWLGQIINAVYATISEFIVTNGEVSVYLEEIYPQHLGVLQMFDEIKIEVYSDNSKSSKQLTDYIVKN